MRLRSRSSSASGCGCDRKSSSAAAVASCSRSRLARRRASEAMRTATPKRNDLSQTGNDCVELARSNPEHLLRGVVHRVLCNAEPAHRTPNEIEMPIDEHPQARASVVRGARRRLACRRIVRVGRREGLDGRRCFRHGHRFTTAIHAIEVLYLKSGRPFDYQSRQPKPPRPTRTPAELKR